MCRLGQVPHRCLSNPSTEHRPVRAGRATVVEMATVASASLKSPEQLVRAGFGRSAVVVVNECHNGVQRCVRTREVGRRMLPCAHEAGVRLLAMEALTAGFAHQANETRQLPEVTHGYLSQPDMRLLISDALALGWDLLAYECEFTARKRGGRENFKSLEFANWRDEEQAAHLVDHFSADGARAPLLVWCGHSHQRKTPQAWDGEGTWVRLGQRLAEHGFDPFVIDQSVTVEYQPGVSPRRADAQRLRSELEALGGTGGFLREEDPDRAWREDRSADAYVLSLHNAME